MRSFEIFLIELLKIGIWDTAFDRLGREQVVDWDIILAQCNQQTIIGVVTDAIVKLPLSIRPSKDKFFLFIKKTCEIEKDNIKMYDLIPTIISEMNNNGIKTWLLKGQGVGLCYRNPYRRMSGDIDLFVGFNANDYEDAQKIIMQLGAKKIEIDNHRKHAGFVLHGITIELHGAIKMKICKQFDQHFSRWMRKCIEIEDCVRKRAKNGQIIFLPPYRFDVIFIFSHMLSHYLTNGVGLRQICDWMCYLTKNHDKINIIQLEDDLKELGLTKFWKMFGTLAVNRLGLKKELMPLYDSRFEGKEDYLLHHIFLTGNFGNIQQNKQQIRGNRIVKKLKTFYGQIYVYWDNLWVFPLETLYCFKYFVTKGLKDFHKVL